ncbi:APH(3') family aminoglycoside O-phosphotransferase [Deinococcus ruber]|uniref:APH(3') family aminoglycoside O-phosphotransferase n=1 Tax=Deinococcus ruber TaxID=1848197 RepID=UPI00166E4E9D|nr:APH(3') family aminoglycoside O-phosphotransferase [Deinococcus ruber]
MSPAAPSSTPPPLPDSLRRVLPAARWEAVTDGLSGAGVWRSSRFVLKILSRTQLDRPLHAEALRLRWAASRLPMPTVVAYDVDDEREYLAMTRIPGIPLHHPDALLHPERVTDLLARALRELHAQPVRDCPFNASLNVRLREARERVAAGMIDETDFDSERSGWTAQQVWTELLRTRPGGEDLVLTHGDACLPNLLLDGEYIAGFVDVGRLGIADRHADIALAHRSLTFNIGPDAAEQFLDIYGRELVKPEKLTYYRLLDELF